LQRYGVDVKQLYTKENLPQLREKSRPEAIDKIKLFLGIKEAIERESLTVDPTEVEERIAEVKTQLSEDVDLDRLQEVVTDELLQEKALDFLAEHAQIELVPPGTLDSEATPSENEDPESEPIASSADPDPDNSQPTE
jgi:trigger factor